MAFPLTPKLMNLNDLERHNGSYFALSHQRVVSDRYANFWNINIRYLRSDTADNRYQYPILRILHLLCLQCNECWWSRYSPELSVIIFRACIDHLTKCSTIVMPPTVIKGCCVWPPVSALLMTLPKTSWLLTVWLLPWDTHQCWCCPHCLPTHDMYCGPPMVHLRWRHRAGAVIGGS